MRTLTHLIFRNSDISICGRNVSKDAVDEFMRNRYPRYDTCDQPCTEMVLAHSSFNLVAELGGYLGLTLGLSLLHLELPLKMIWHQIVVWKIKGQSVTKRKMTNCNQLRK